MKLTKQVEEEIKQVMDDYWNSYFEGNLDHWANYLVDDYRNIGGTEEEIWNSKKEILDYTFRVIDQMKEATELRNKQTEIIPYDPYIMVHELLDIYIKIEDEWTFYQKFRLSSLIQKNAEGWKVLHQHGSYPDSKTTEGEAFAFDTLKSENQKLQKAIKDRTRELEIKNQELKVEASLERVRSQTMAMHQSEELLQVIAELSNQLQQLGFYLDTANFNLHYRSKDWDLWTCSAGTSIPLHICIPFADHPLFNQINAAIDRGDDLVCASLNRKDKDSFVQHIFETTLLKDLPEEYKKELLDKEGFVCSVVFSKNTSVTIGKYDCVAYSDEQNNILKRFSKAFEQAYTRFFDLQKAEAQAREAKIEAALERVRSRTMAMHKSEELSEVIIVVSEQLLQLNFKFDNVSFGINNNDYDINFRMAAKSQPYPLQIHAPYIDNPMLNRLREAQKNGVEFFADNLTKEENCEWIRHMINNNEVVKNLPEERKIFLLNSGYSRSTVIMKNINLFIGNYAAIPYTDEENAIIRRFANVFEQSYTRFLDLQKAEGQAREAQIELGLERVRARAMAMQNSEELKELIGTVFIELTKLDIVLTRCLLMIYDPKTNGSTWWMANSEAPSQPIGLFVQYHKQPPYLAYIKAWQEKQLKWTYPLEGEIKKQWDDFLFVETELSHLPDFVIAGMKAPDKVYLNASFNTFGNLTLATLEPLSDEHFDIMLRFAKVFDLTYTRFNDLQKAEAQAKEAKIEAALEKVRSRSLAMYKSDELNEVVLVVFEKLKQLNVVTDGVALINLYTEGTKDVTQWIANPDLMTTGKFSLPYFDHPLLNIIWDARQSGKNFVTHTFSFEEKNSFWNHSFQHSDYKFLPDDLKKMLLESEGYGYAVAFEKYSGLLVCTYNNKPFSADAVEILRRFATVFEQAYIRFLDLQKAEAQTRESQIQLALERVRARTMAMHKSEELGDISFELVKQVQSLGVATWHCAFNIYDEDQNSSTEWGSNAEGNYPKYKTPREGLFLKYYEIGQTGETLHIEFIGEDKCTDHYNWLCTLPGVGDQLLKFRESGGSFPTSQIDHVAYFKYGYLIFITYEPAPEAHDIFKRFAKIFEQTYTRFLDLQKAEAQATEAKIEAALERVRYRAMAMQSSEDVGAATAVVFNEISLLGIETMRCGICIMHPDKTAEVWAATTTNEGKVMKGVGSINMEQHSLWKGMHKAWQEKKDHFTYHLKEDDLKAYYAALANTPTYSAPYLKDELPEHFFYASFFEEGAVFTFSLQEHNEEDQKIIKKFTAVFSLTFRRYQDLKKAEAQTREAQIEASLERVRSRAMAMHKSDELLNAGELLYRELSKFGIVSMTCGYVIMDEEEKIGWIYAASPLDGSILPKPTGLPHTNSVMASIKESWKKQEPFHVVELDAQATIEHHTYLAKNSIDFLFTLEEFLAMSPETIVMHSFNFRQGYLLVVSLMRLTASQEEMVVRFTKVFEMTYRRYLDLQKAEAQAREATIEAALEKVRGKAMAMHNSTDLSSAASMVFTELRKLGINPIRCGVGLLNKESRKAQLYSATSSKAGDSLSLVGWVMLSGHPVLENIYDTWLKNEDYYPQLQGEQLKSYYELLLTGLPVTIPDWQSGQKQYGHFLPFSVGCLYAWSDVPYNDAEIKILKRFATIIDLTFRRYIELKKSEANAKEAIKQAALDRIRADIASMRTVNDLDRIIPLIWNELIILGVPFIRCGVFIMDEEQQLIHTFLSTPDGKAIAAFHIPYTTPGNIKQVINHWRNNKNYIDHWDEEAFTEFAETLVKQGALASPGQYLKTIPHGGFYLHFLPFLQGMLYVGNTNQLSEEEIKLIQSVAGAFSTAYARYEDFNKLEAAKQQVDKTLTELKSTQKQLIQSEKMASLGELTAGIAHEIQNPLNFVNNFSEVSNELIEELKMKNEQLKIEDEDVNELLKDIKQNLEKINHHGKRADAIVKGMLQHSRASTGKKELTDINALADEYLRLSYHGLRAKDKSFNAAFKTDFDESIDKINIVPQDIGRVILNLLTNAFYAVNEKKQSNNNGYEPTVTVSTKKIADKIEIRVGDNGNGIPQKVLDKIFQPFFTTKPTGQGTGLGLSLSYDIIKTHGGEIKVKTKEGEGTEFVIQLPI